MGVFSGFGSAKTWGSSDYIVPGTYKLKIEEIKVVASQRHHGRSYFIVSAKVVESSVDKHPAGKTVAWNVNMANAEMAMANIKQFAYALFPDLSGETDGEQEAAMDALISDEQPAVGMRIDVEAWTIMVGETKDREFTKVKWLTAPDSND